MSRKNTDQAERNARKIKKALRNTPPGFIDLIEYVKIRTHCTTGMARKVLLSGSLRVDSHPVGFEWSNDRQGDAYKRLQPYLPAKHRDSIVVNWDTALNA